MLSWKPLSRRKSDVNKEPVVSFENWLQPRRGDSILDIGCNNGSKVARLHTAGIFAVGIDVNKEVLKKSTVRGLILADAIILPFKSAVFTKVICTEVLEHVSSDTKLLAEVARILKPRGLLFLSTPHSVHSLDCWDPAWLKWKLLNSEHTHRHYSIVELSKKLASQKLRIEKLQVLFGLSWLILRWFNVFLKYVLRRKKQFTYKATPDGNFDLVVLARRHN